MGTDIHCGLEKRLNKTKVFKFVKYLDFHRNYLLFAALADVRNGYGCAGCDTGDAIVPISEPKGLPENIDKLTENILSHEHSASYLSKEELLSYDWNQIVTRRGLIAPGTKIGKYGQPTEWCGGTNNPLYTPHEWKIPLIECIPLKMKALLKFLRTTKDDYRIVFDFDS